eukprot:COSAG02_NODE_1269_length_13533_cov_7.935016_8_plen_76_part_00
MGLWRASLPILDLPRTAGREMSRALALALRGPEARSPRRKTPPSALSGVFSLCVPVFHNESIGTSTHVPVGTDLY